MRKSPALFLALAALLGACAPAAAPNGVKLAEPLPTVSDNGSNTTVRINPDDPRTATAMRATPANVWAALPSVYAELGIETNMVDPDAMVLGNVRFSGAEIGGRRTGAYVRCANEGSAASSMNRQRYRLTVLTTLRPAATGTGTTVTTRVDGSASAVDASRSAASYCASTGELEKRIVELLQARVGV